MRLYMLKPEDNSCVLVSNEEVDNVREEFSIPFFIPVFVDKSTVGEFASKLGLENFEITEIYLRGDEQFLQ